MSQMWQQLWHLKPAAICCPEDFEKAYNGVKEAVDNGSISEQRIDDALRRIYRIKFADRISVPEGQ